MKKSRKIRIAVELVIVAVLLFVVYIMFGNIYKSYATNAVNAVLENITAGYDEKLPSINEIDSFCIDGNYDDKGKVSDGLFSVPVAAYAYRACVITFGNEYDENDINIWYGGFAAYKDGEFYGFVDVNTGENKLESWSVDEILYDESIEDKCIVKWYETDGKIYPILIDYTKDSVKGSLELNYHFDESVKEVSGKLSIENVYDILPHYEIDKSIDARSEFFKNAYNHKYFSKTKKVVFAKEGPIAIGVDRDNYKKPGVYGTYYAYADLSSGKSTIGIIIMVFYLVSALLVVVVDYKLMPDKEKLAEKLKYEGKTKEEIKAIKKAEKKAKKEADKKAKKEAKKKAKEEAKKKAKEEAKAAKEAAKEAKNEAHK